VEENFWRISAASRTEPPESSRYIIKSGGPKSCAKLQVVPRTCIPSLAGVTEELGEGERSRKGACERARAKRIYGGANEAPRIESRPNLRR